MFLNIEKNKIFVLTNEIWTEKNKTEYEKDLADGGDEENFSRHAENDNYIWRIRYSTYPEVGLSYEER